MQQRILSYQILQKLKNRFFSFNIGTRYLSTLVVAEPTNTNHEVNSTTLSSTFSSIQAAKCFKQPINLFLSGKQSQSAAEIFKNYEGVDKIFIATGEAANKSLPDSLSSTLSKVIKETESTAVIGPVCSAIKDIFPRCAAHFDVQPISDVISINDPATFVRMTYAGNAICTISSDDHIKIASIRPSAFQSDEDLAKTDNPAPIVHIEALTHQIKWLEDKSSQTDSVQLDNAKVIVSGGRGLKNKENFNILLSPLCQKLNAALGASRAAIDSGFVPNELQIGQTGKIVAPNLYFAVGISGAIQHLAGMKDSKIIVAINKDTDAPIFQVSDYGLIGDLFTIIPELTEKIKSQ